MSRRPPKACAASATIGKYKPKVKGSGPYEVCLSPTQRKELFGDQKVIGKSIGCGTFACVWQKDNGQVVKLTKDREDVEGLLSAKGSDRVVKVISIAELPASGLDVRSKKVIPVYAITAEKLTPLTSSQQKWLSKPLNSARTALLKSAEKYRGPAKQYQFPQPSELGRRACKGAVQTKKCETFISQFADAFGELFRKGVVFQDAHGGNFGIDSKGRWKILDLGYSGIKKRSIVPVLNGPSKKLRVLRRVR